MISYTINTKIGSAEIRIQDQQNNLNIQDTNTIKNIITTET